MIHILREIKLSNLTDTPMSTKATKLVEFWGELWSGMKVKIDPKKGEIRCWRDDYDYYYFYQEDRNDYLWCDTEKIWSFFRRDLGLNYDGTQELIHQMVDETLNYIVNTPISSISPTNLLVDETLNYIVNTPRREKWINCPTVDETLKCKVNTPTKLHFILPCKGS